MEKRNPRRSRRVSTTDQDACLDLTAAIHRAMTALLQCRAPKVPGIVELSEISGIDRLPVDAKSRYPLGVHVNHQPELCVCLYGNAGMEILDQRFCIGPLDVVYLAPGTPHSEGYVDAKDTYQLLWMSIVSDAVSVSCVEHNASGWHFPFRVICQSEVAKSLKDRFDRLPHGHGQPSREFEAFRSLWLSVLAASLAQTTETQTHQKDQDPVRQMMQEVREHIDRHLSARLSMNYLARYSGFTGAHLNRLFRRHFGSSVHAYVIQARLQEARRQLAIPGATVQAVAVAVGYDDALYFSKAYRQQFGHPPSTDLVKSQPL